MQYALFSIRDDQFRPMLDAAEIYPLEMGVDQLIDQEPREDEEANLTLTIVYGTYKPQPDLNFPKSEIKRHILADVNHWLVHLNGLKTVYLAFDDIEPFFDVTLVSGCGHCPKPHATQDVAFAALMRLPKDFVFGKTLAKTAYLRWHNMDALTNALNRKGLYALIAPERRFTKALTKDNWRERIDQKRAIKYAQKWR